MSDSTVVVASLSDDELQKSINNMVANFDKGLQKMVNHTNTKVDEIKKKLTEIGSVNFGSKFTTDTGNSKRISSNNSERKSVENLVNSYYHLLGAFKFAQRTESLFSGKNIFTLNREELGRYQKAVEDVIKLKPELDKVKGMLYYENAEKISKSMAFDTKSAAKGFRGSIDERLTQLNNYYAKQEILSQKAAQAQQQATKEAQKQSSVINTITKETETAAEAEKIRLSLIKQVAAEARKVMQVQQVSSHLFQDGHRSGLVYAENDARAKGLSIEEQIAKIIEQQDAATRQVLDNEKNITQEVAKRGKKYVSPTMNDDLHDITRYAIANKLGIDQSKVINADAQYDSIKRVGDALRQLQDTYIRMDNYERNSPLGKNVLRQMQELQRQSQKLRTQMSRPISLKDALRGSEKTLDDIAYKIRRLQSYMQGLDTSNEKSAAEFKRAATNVRLLEERENELLSKNSKLIGSNNSLIASNTALGRSWNYMKNRLAFYFTVGASTQFIKNLVDVRSQYEMNERALGILINSAERGTQIFNELSQMALVSPYSLIELSGAAKQLTAYDIAAKDVVDTTRRLADMASAVGVPIDRLTYALGQIKAYGYLNSRDARMFANAGIPLVKELADYYTQLEGKLVSTADVYDRIKKKAVDYNEVMQVINKMTDEGGRFFDFQAKMAETLKTQLANLVLAWNNMLNEMGESTQGLTVTLIATAKKLFLAWKDVEDILTQVVVVFGVVKTVQLLSTLAIGKQTMATLKYVNANKLATASDYKRALSSKNLTAEQARWLVLTNSSNKALVSAIGKMKLLTAAELKSLTTLNAFRRGFVMLSLSWNMALKGLIAGFKALGTAMIANWPLLLLTAGISLYQHFSQISENNKELNKDVAEGAKEASKAIEDFLKEDDKVQLRLKARQKALSESEGQKGWDAVREQLETSAMSYKMFMEELLKIPDINVRISKSFDYAESIKKSADALAGLEDELQYSQDGFLGIGDGIIDDIKDAAETLTALKNAPDQLAASIGDLMSGNTYQDKKNELKRDLKEAGSEIQDWVQKTAQVIKEELGAEGLKDKIQVGEAVERAMRALEQKGGISGMSKVLFETIAGGEFSKQLGKSYDVQEKYYQIFLEQLGKDYSSKFSEISEGINTETLRWNKGQLDAIQKTGEKIKEALPAASQDAINQILKQLNTTEFKMHIVAEFSKDKLSKEQSAFQDYFINAGTAGFTADKADKIREKNRAKYQTLMKKSGEDNVEYEKRITDEKKKQLDLVKSAQAIINKGGNFFVIQNAKKEVADAKNTLDAINKIQNWGGYDFTVKDKTSNKKRKQAESELQKALKDEITLINNARSSYDKLAKAGYKNKDILSIVSNQFGSTIAHINKVLGKNGIPLFDINSISGADNPKLEQKMLKAQIEAAKKARRAKPSEIKDLEVEYSKVTVDAKVFDFSQLTKQLENKANMLKDEYELSLEISSDPNLGNLFLNAFDINIDTLPSTAKEYADMLTVEVNKYLKGKNVGFTLPTINLTKDDIAAFEKLKDEKKISEEVYNTLVKYSKTANDAIKKENISTAKSFNTLYSQYADLDTKLTKVQQDAAAEQLTLIKKYGSSEDIKTALNLIEQMSIDATPADINRLSKQLIDVTNRVAKKAEGKGAIKLYNAINTKNTKDVAKTTWDDFKDSEYYSMMFDNMEKLSVNSISEIMAKLDELKDKVKEDPASMKALMDAYNNAEKELIKKKPFDSIIKSLIEWRNAAKEVKLAQENLDAANIGVKRAEIGLSGAQALGDKKAIAEATEKLTKAQEKQKKATKELRQAENQEAQAQSNFTQSLNAASSACSNVSSMLSQVVSLLGLAEDSDAAVVINDMAKAFSALSTVLGVVAAMALLAQLSLGWIGWAAMALSAIVGLLSSITNAKNNKINKQIKESELAVKRLENTYKNLEDAINNAFGASITGAKQAAIENKKLQLVELERQLQLEQSRTGKHYDADKVEDLKGKVIDLRNELKNSIQNLSSDLLGISSVGDAAQNFMKDYIDALRKGEDAQKVFAGSFKDMIATMITQLYVAKVVAPRLQEVMDSLNQAVTDRTKDEAKAYQDAVALQTHYSTMSNDDIKKELARQRAEAQGSGLLAYFAIYSQLQDAEIEELKKEVDKNVIEAKKRLDKASVPLTEDMDSVAQQGQDMLELMKQSEEGLKDLLNRYDLYDDGSNKNLSALQQGIQSITEETAGALEGITNGISQQVYYHSSLLEQIRDAVVGFDMDVQMGVFSQMLLQLQNSYTLMQSMQTMMENWTIPSGSGIRVQLLS